MTDTHTTPDSEHVPASALDRLIVKVGDGISWLYFIAVVISVLEVIMRYLFDSPTSWVHETTLMMVGLCMLWGGTYCMAENRHIRVSVVRDLLPKKVGQVIDAAVSVLTLFFCSGLAYAGFTMVKKSYFDPAGNFRILRSGSALTSPAPTVVKTMLFFVLILMTLQAIIQLVKRFKILTQGSDADSKE